MAKIPNGWTVDGNSLKLILKLASFKRAVAMLNSVADYAEKLNHHPNMAIKNYNELVIVTTTHSENGLTEKDYELAKMVTDLLEYQSKKEEIELNGSS